MEATKIRLVTDPLYASSTSRRCARSSPRTGGRPLWQGVAPILVRQVPYTVAKLAATRSFPSICGIPGAGVLAGSAAAVVSQPGDVVPARLCGGSAQARLTGVVLLMPPVGAVLSSITTRPQLFVASTAGVLCAVVCASHSFHGALRPAFRRSPFSRSRPTSFFAHRFHFQSLTVSRNVRD